MAHSLRVFSLFSTSPMANFLDLVSEEFMVSDFLEDGGEYV